ncbi:hypothetical protein Hanom_Chr15g01376561 [Helianthus anomalus]
MLALPLCNADRVVMSVTIVPLSQSRVWSQAFAGVVQCPSQAALTALETSITYSVRFGQNPSMFFSVHKKLFIFFH